MIPETVKETENKIFARMAAAETQERMEG